MIPRRTISAAVAEESGTRVGVSLTVGRIRREVIALGRLQGAGIRSKQEIADYVLVYKNQKLSVIEVKRESAGVTEGLGQAKNYAGKLQTRFAFSTNGHGIYRVDMQTAEEGDVDRYPTPAKLWDAVGAGKANLSLETRAPFPAGR